jgi:hypothetical protein
MYALAQHEAWRQRPEEIRREVSAFRLEKAARANSKRESGLSRELARYAGVFGKRLRNPRYREPRPGTGARTMMNLTQNRTGTSKMLALGVLLVALMAATLLAANPSYAAGTTFTVDSTVDASDADQADNTCDASVSSTRVCTLRAAIEQANTNNDPTQVDRINFDIPGTGVHTISPDSSLPAITEPVVINGYSQPGSSVNTLAKGTNAKLLIQINGTSVVGTGLTVSASNSVVRGLIVNRIPLSDAIGIFPETSADVVSNVRVEGIFLGTDPTGTLDRGNGDSGVFLFATSGNTIGGASRASRNLISSNNLAGVFIEGAGFSGFGSADGNLIQGNLIGTQRDGLKPLGNGLPSVDVLTDTNDATANGNRILSNSIFSNGGLGIDLGDDGLTANDPGDADSGENGLQNRPSLGSARNVSGKTTIKGTLNSRPGATYTVQYFSNPTGTDEGRTFLGQKTGVVVDGSGHGTFTFSPSSKVAVGQTITATATNEFTGDTSEFSAAKGVVAG